MRLSAVRIFVDDLDAARKFYREALGLRLREEAPREGWLVFESEGVRVIIESLNLAAESERRDFVGRFLGISFEVNDLADEYARLVGLGVRFAGPPALQPWGGSLATLFDAAGNQLQLVQYGR